MTLAKTNRALSLNSPSESNFFAISCPRGGFPKQIAVYVMPIDPAVFFVMHGCEFHHIQRSNSRFDRSIHQRDRKPRKSFENDNTKSSNNAILRHSCN